MVIFTDKQVTIKRESSVITLPVTMRTVTIDGKQMTLSAFKRLPVIPSLDLQTDEICGWVNHHAPAMCNGFEHCERYDRNGFEQPDHLHGLGITKERLVRFLVFKSQHGLFKFVHNQKQVYYV